jgi:hypothetical protein
VRARHRSMPDSVTRPAAGAAHAGRARVSCGATRSRERCPMIAAGRLVGDRQRRSDPGGAALTHDIVPPLIRCRCPEFIRRSLRAAASIDAGWRTRPGWTRPWSRRCTHHSMVTRVPVPVGLPRIGPRWPSQTTRWNETDALVAGTSACSGTARDQTSWR